MSACNYVMMLVEHGGCRQTKIVAADLSEVVIVGGCSHIPGVQRALLSVFHVMPVARDCDDAAARGASMQAWGVSVKVCKSSHS